MLSRSILINVTGFQAGWFACVLFAARNQPASGVMIALLVIALHVYLQKNKPETLILLLTVTLLGTLWDGFISSQNILIYDSGIIAPYLPPVWIIIMWTLFATTITISLKWLYGHYWYAMIIGAICGPLVYQAGAALGAVNIPDTITATIYLSLGWSVILPSIIKLAELLETNPDFQEDLI